MTGIILIIVAIIALVVFLYASLHIIASADMETRAREEWVAEISYHNERALNYEYENF